MQRKTNRLISVWHRFCQKAKERWIASSIILNLQGFWFSLIIVFLGEKLNLIIIQGNGRRLTTLGWICTGIVLALTILYTLVNKYNQTHVDDTKQLAEAKIRLGTIEQMLALFGEGC